MGHEDRASDFGGSMKRLREANGVTLRDIAASTKVAVSSLDALERNDVKRLPGGIFLRAMVRSYAHEIGADPEAAVRDFVAAFPNESVTSGLETGRYDSAEPHARTTRTVAIVAAIVLCAAIILAWSFLALT